MGIVKGVDLGWLTQLEATKVSWVDAKGEKVDPLKYMKEMGVNGVRLRVFVNPPEEAYWNKKDNERCMLGFCDIESVVRMAKRVKSEGLSLMIDIHYSDHFADPEYQDIPEAWLNEDFEGLKEKVTQAVLYVEVTLHASMKQELLSGLKPSLEFALFDENSVKVAEGVQRVESSFEKASGDAAIMTGLDEAIPEDLYSNTLTVLLSVNNPTLWSPDTPTLYTLQITLKNQGQELDFRYQVNNSHLD